jgi:hypothetical protein
MEGSLRLLPVVAPLGIVMLIGAPAVEGHFYSGDDLLAMCQDNDRSQTCLGYIQGVVDALQVTAEAGGSKWGACVTGVTAGQMRDITIRRIKEFPVPRDGTASAYIQKALVTAFPCEAVRPGPG